MEISSVSEANGNNLGKEAKAAPPAAKSRFVFAFSRPVPGRTDEPATKSSVASAQLDVSSEAARANKASSEAVGLPAAAVPEEASDKTLSEASLSEIELTGPAEAEDAVPSKPKELTFFDRLFKVEKAKDKNKTQDQSQQEVTAETPEVAITVEGTAGLQSTPDNVLQGKGIVDECNRNAAQPDSAGADCLASEDLAQEEVKPETIKTAGGSDYNNAVMSFFKTLVSPSKGDSKTDTEDKAKKDTQQMANTKDSEQPASSTSVKSEANVLQSQEIPPIKQTAKAPEPPIQQQPTPPAAMVITNETPKELTKERSSSTPTPLSKFFWKKTPTDDIEVINTERMEAPPEAPAKDENKSQEVAETKPKGDEKPSKANLRKFFKLTVKSDARVTPSEEVNGQAPDHQNFLWRWTSLTKSWLVNLMTLDFTDRPLTQAESRESVGERSKEGSTEKLNKQKENKQEVSKDQQESQEQETVETDSLQNGGDAAKENTPKRVEKKQSFGGFFKGLSAKRMSDAEVQTDPVSIGPVGPIAKPK
ncbi:breast carcinoma-amplified sequence 1 isoform X3 [Hemicordylus capensis]|uniref:breast carcinoma-amplified sequence 1 isoform X3 n=1 Tax=Hemicordylus capensis TaxID=884348 RepID=UPI00230232AD|nr:breast carcinoma-amplified sequence 1 isoform X3 [Hemicordylus capensis]